MNVKKAIILLAVYCIFLTGCADPQTTSGENNALADNQITATTENYDTADNGQATATQIMIPLPDTTMANLTDATLSISLDEGNAYVDDNGYMQMDIKIYTYDKYDMVDVANLNVGDTIVRYSGEVKVISIEQNETGTIHINGGLDNGGFDLVTNGCGIFYESGFNDVKNWYEIGEATIPVSADFNGTDSADLEQGEVIIYPGDFLIGAVTNYDFTPYNTTIRVEDGQIVGMNRVFIP